MPGRTHLVIPDSHCRYGVSNERFRWLSKLVLDLKPDKIINLGDMYDMESLSAYDKGKKAMELRRYWKDLQAGHEALETFHTPINKFNARRTKGKKRNYRPQFVFTVGNHEDRITRAVQADAILENTISLKDLKLEEYGWDVYPYLKPVVIDGISYVHCMQNRNSATPISGLHHGYSLVTKYHRSVTVGHSHLLSYYTDTDATGKRLHGLVAGCFFEDDLDYAKLSNRNWWRGVAIKRNVSNGDYDLELLSLKRLKELYGH